ncbi:hypothetical protein BTJ40_10235 [Microbulbifer sp. A4B17]|uniref:hypothetical protein n=1 Tax=Microbulbifer sp. A4B17 TaxID=359370 RepID=UPI000D52EB32|nr:hypothetical protein [Microbulbifer sp. A4B17]AWF81165.1 hypothetical protein BTJ40_10235 [Microbulbifer sp. A4B17]
MNVARLSFLLIALLVFQTAGAFYDSHDELEDITYHFSSTHTAPSQGAAPDSADEPADVSLVSSTPLSSAGDDQSAPVLDFCNHCCHCHGINGTGLLGHSYQPLLWGSLTYGEVAGAAVPSGYFSPLLRPPIAQV